MNLIELYFVFFLLFLSSDFGPFLEDEIDILLTGFGCEFFGFLERFVWSWDAVFESNPSYGSEIGKSISFMD